MATQSAPPDPHSKPASKQDSSTHPSGTPKKSSAWGQVARYSAIGMTIPSHLVAGWLIGTLLDRFFSTDYLYIVFLLVGIVSGFIEMIRLASRNPD